MIALEVVKKIRDDIADKKTLIFSDSPEMDRINLLESLDDYIDKEEAKCKKRNKLTSD